MTEWKLVAASGRDQLSGKFIEQMRALFTDAVGREMRRTKARGIAEIGRSRPAYPGTSSIPAAPVEAPAPPASPSTLDDHIPF